MYGKDYAKGEYGWANELLNRKASFRDIEAATDMGNLRELQIIFNVCTWKL